MVVVDHDKRKKIIDEAVELLLAMGKTNVNKYSIFIIPDHIEWFKLFIKAKLLEEPCLELYFILDDLDEGRDIIKNTKLSIC